jgi:hypothetical protein
MVAFILYYRNDLKKLCAPPRRHRAAARRPPPPPPRAGAAHRQTISGSSSQAAGMQPWIRDLIDLKTQISALENCMQQPASSHAGRRAQVPVSAGCRVCYRRPALARLLSAPTSGRGAREMAASCGAAARSHAGPG